MNLLLLDILACPTDKNFPLNLHIFSFKDNLEEIENAFSLYQTRNIALIEKEKIIKYSEINGELYLEDLIVNRKSLVDDYLKELLSILDLLQYIFDYTSNNISEKYCNLITSEIKSKLIKFLADKSNDKLKEILPDLYLINKFFLNVILGTGVLICKKCNRWYPIYEGIPQLLPDNQRNIKEEKDRLGKMSEYLDQILAKLQ